MTLQCSECGREFEALVRFYRECTPCFLERVEKNPGGGKKVIVTCRTCGVDFEMAVIGEDAKLYPAGHECGACYKGRVGTPDDDDNDLPDTDVCEGDDPDQYLGIPD